ncbi:hypothetical protein B7463_g2186, partial [Scytalidium lignicola]
MMPSTALHSFKVVKPQAARRNRAKFDPKRRQEVKACSNDDLCTSCRGLTSYERRTLSFSGCIRTRLLEVDIFELPNPNLEQRSSILTKSREFASTAVTLSFASDIKWSLSALVVDMVDWVNSPHTSTTSKVGTLSSPEFLETLKPYFEKDTLISFQHMLHAQSLAYTQSTSQGTHFFSILELQQIGGMAGHNFLKVLDRSLRCQSLASYSKEHLHALFLLIVGTILAVGYTKPFQKTGNDLSAHQTSFTAMQEFLNRILAHYMVFFSSKLDLGISGDCEQLILKAASARWNKLGSFLWVTFNALMTEDGKNQHLLSKSTDIPTLNFHQPKLMNLCSRTLWKEFDITDAMLSQSEIGMQPSLVNEIVWGEERSYYSPGEIINGEMLQQNAFQFTPDVTITDSYLPARSNGTCKAPGVSLNNGLETGTMVPHDVSTRLITHPSSIIQDSEFADNWKRELKEEYEKTKQTVTNEAICISSECAVDRNSAGAGAELPEREESWDWIAPRKDIT